MSNSINHARGTLADTLHAKLIHEIKHLRDSWQKTPEADQKAVIDRLRLEVDNAVSRAVQQIAGAGFTHFSAQLESLAVKDGIKAVLTLPQHDKHVDQLVERVGSIAVLVLVNLEDYIGGLKSVTAMPDEPELPLGEPAPADKVGDALAAAGFSPTQLIPPAAAAEALL